MDLKLELQPHSYDDGLHDNLLNIFSDDLAFDGGDRLGDGGHDNSLVINERRHLYAVIGDESERCDGGCADSDPDNCPYWAGLDYCDASSIYHGYMTDNCKKSCGVCNG